MTAKTSKPVRQSKKPALQKSAETVSAKRQLADASVSHEPAENVPGEFESYGKVTCIREDGLYLRDFVDGIPGKFVRVCDDLWPQSMICNEDGTQRAYLIKFKNQTGEWVTREIPVEAFIDEKTLHKTLLKAGFTFALTESSKAAYVIKFFVEHACPTDKTSIRSRTPGWHMLPDGSSGYTQNGIVYGGTSEKFVLHAPHGQKLPEQSVGRKNEFLALMRLLKRDALAVLVVCAAFASVLLRPTGQSSKAIFLIGTSSIGKSILLKLASAIFSTIDKVMTWSGTDNGFEAHLAEHTDKPFVVDEVSQSNGRQFSQLAYRLLNGASKLRANSNGQTQSAVNTRTVLISAGEQSPFDLMRQAGMTIQKGQEARLIPIPVQEDYGVWSCVSEFSSGAEKSAEVLKRLPSLQAIAVKGFCRRVVPKIDDLAVTFEHVASDLADELRGDIVIDPNDNVPERVLQSFTLFAYAGLVAVHYKILPWTEHRIMRAIRRCYALWYTEYQRNQPIKDDALLMPVRAFLQSQRGNKFKPLKQWHEDSSGVVAGYEYESRKGEPAFLIHPPYFEKHLCGDHEAKAVLQALRKAGYLIEGSRGVPTLQVHLPGTDKRKSSFYAIRRSILLN